MNLYIDTNILLTFYHLTKDDLNELKKLALLIEDGQITLYLPEQTRNEFVRNRDKTILEAINALQEQKVSSRYPQIAKDYEEYELLNQAYREFEKHKNKIISKIRHDAKESKLNADILIARIFNSSLKIEIEDDLFEASRRRFDLGNPPGKGHSYGDAMNWETLLNYVDDKEDLYLISDDGDFSSILDRSVFNSFLKDEWEKKKNSKVFFFKTLSEYFEITFPHIKLLDQLEKELEIRGLAEARSFASAKSRLAKLAKYKEFTIQELNDILEISLSNNQILWISSDKGVGDVLHKLFEGNREKLEVDLMAEFDKVYGEPPKD